MKYPERKSVRLPGFDYSQAGAYFVTICSYNKKCIFGEIVDARMHLNKRGFIIGDVWKSLESKYTFISLDKWILMPNHIHGIIWLKEENHGRQTLWSVISAFKVISGSAVRKVLAQEKNLWQRSFYEHIIRDESDLLRIRQYISDNPCQWHIDRENPEVGG